MNKKDNTNLMLMKVLYESFTGEEIKIETIAQKLVKQSNCCACCNKTIIASTCCIDIANGYNSTGNVMVFHLICERCNDLLQFAFQDYSVFTRIQSYYTVRSHQGLY